MFLDHYGSQVPHYPIFASFIPKELKYPPQSSPAPKRKNPESSSHRSLGLWVQHDGAAACSSCHRACSCHRCHRERLGSGSGGPSTRYAMASPWLEPPSWSQIFAEQVPGVVPMGAVVIPGWLLCFSRWLWIWAAWSTKQDVLRVYSGKSFCLGLGPLKLHRSNQHPWLEYLHHRWEWIEDEECTRHVPQKLDKHNKASSICILYFDICMQKSG